MCNGIAKRANLFKKLLKQLDGLFVPLIEKMETIIGTEGLDFSKYSPESQKVIAVAMSVAGAIKKVLDTPILSEDGQVTQDSKEVGQNISGFLKEHEESYV